MLSPLRWATILTIILLQFQLKFWHGTKLELEWGSSVFKLPCCLVTPAIRFSITYLMNMYIIIYPLMISTETIFSHFLFFILSRILSISTVYLFNYWAEHHKAKSIIPLQQLTHFWAAAAHGSQSISITLLYWPASKQHALDSEAVLPDI
jgi:hypothetical protein